MHSLVAAVPSSLRVGQAALRQMFAFFQQLVVAMRVWFGSIRAAECILPVGARDEASGSNDDRKAAASWAKMNLMLSFSGGLAMASIPSGLLFEYWSAFAAYAVGLFVSFGIAMFVHSLGSCLNKTVMVVLLSSSSFIIFVAFAMVLTVFLHKGATPNPPVSHGP